MQNGIQLIIIISYTNCHGLINGRQSLILRSAVKIKKRGKRFKGDNKYLNKNFQAFYRVKESCKYSKILGFKNKTVSYKSKKIILKLYSLYSAVKQVFEQ